jgi:WD40 repeat protein
LSPDGGYILSTGLDQALKLWEVGSGRCLYTFTSGTDALQTLCWSEDGAYALSGEADPGHALKVWSVAGEAYQAPSKLCRTLGSSEIYSAQQRYRQALEQARQALGQGEAVTAALHLQEARAQPGFRRAEEALQLWRQLYLKLGRQGFLGGWVEAVVTEERAEITSLALNPQGDYALSGSVDALLKLWRLTPAAGGRPGSVVCLRTFSGHKAAVNALCLSASGRLALSGSAEWRGLKLWEVDSGRCLHTFDGHGEAVTAVCLSQDERYALSGGVDQKLKLWDVSRGYCLRTLGGHTGPISAVCFSAAGQYALSASLDQSLKLWDMVTGRCWRTFTGHEAPVTALVLSQDERYFLSGSQDGSLKLWSLASGRCLRTFTGHTGAISSLCLSPDRQYALSGSADKTFKLWKVATGKCLRTFKGHREAVTAVALSQDGQYILSGSRDQSLQLWALDWELAPNPSGDWDERAGPYLALFLAGQTPYLETLPEGREPFPEDMTLALIRQGAPIWNEADLERLGQMLSRAGYGWLQPEGVRRKLAELSQNWPAFPILPGVEPDLYRQLCQATIYQAQAARQNREKAWAARRERWRWQKPLGRGLSLGWRIPVAISTIAAGMSEGNKAGLKGVLPLFTFIFSIPLVILLIPALLPALLFMLLQDLFAFRNNYHLSQKLLKEGVMAEARVRRKQMERGILYNSPEYSVEYSYQAPEPATRLLTTFTNREPVSPEFYAWLKPETILQVRYLAGQPQTARIFFHGFLSRRT